MERIVLDINPKSKAGKMLKDLLDLIADKQGVKIVEEKSPYNAEFVEKIKRAEKEKGRSMTTAESLWDSI